MSELLQQITNIIIAPSAWLVQLFETSGVWQIFVSTITFVILFRYLIIPLTGTSASGISDAVQKDLNDRQAYENNAIRVRTNSANAHRRNQAFNQKYRAQMAALHRRAEKDRIAYKARMSRRKSG